LRPSGTDLRADLLAIYRAGLRAVDGYACVSRFLGSGRPSGPVALVAIGKAASAMATGARAVLGDQLVQGLVITRTGQLAAGLQQDPRFVCLEAGHPVPNATSLAAGETLTRFLQECPERSERLLLLSGGTSSLVEVLPDTVNLAALQALNQWLLASGLPIQDINRVRCAVSRIKGGRLAHWLGPHPATVLLLSDVADDDPAVIGSGLLFPAPVRPLDELALPDWVSALCRAGQCGRVSVNPSSEISHHVIAGLDDALDAAYLHARQLGYPATIVHRQLAGDALQAGHGIASQLATKPAGVYLWGGETTVTLPPGAGRGGRCQSLALAAACVLAGREDIVLLAAGTDGTDGPGTAAGAIVDGNTPDRGAVAGLDARRCLQQANAGGFLEASGDLLVTGPTATNVTDLVIAIKSE